MRRIANNLVRIFTGKYIIINCILLWSHKPYWAIKYILSKPLFAKLKKYQIHNNYTQNISPTNLRVLL